MRAAQRQVLGTSIVRFVGILEAKMACMAWYGTNREGAKCAAREIRARQSRKETHYRHGGSKDLIDSACPEIY